MLDPVAESPIERANVVIETAFSGVGTSVTVSTWVVSATKTTSVPRVTVIERSSFEADVVSNSVPSYSKEALV